MPYTTILLDHDVIDGAPIARFIAQLAGHLEGALGLEAYQHAAGKNHITYPRQNA